jgi:hypothetical protein
MGMGMSTGMHGHGHGGECSGQEAAQHGTGYGYIRFMGYGRTDRGRARGRDMTAHTGRTDKGQTKIIKNDEIG